MDSYVTQGRSDEDLLQNDNSFNYFNFSQIYKSYFLSNKGQTNYRLYILLAIFGLLIQDFFDVGRIDWDTEVRIGRLFINYYKKIYTIYIFYDKVCFLCTKYLYILILQHYCSY